MPRIDPVNPVLPQVTIQSLDVAAAPYEARARAAAGVAGEAMEWMQREKELRQNRAVMEQSLAAELEADELYRKSLADPDFDNHDKRVAEGLKKIGEERAAAIKDSEAKQAFRARFANLYSGKVIEARDQTRKNQIDAGIAAFQQSLDAREALAASATGEELDRLLTDTQADAAAAVSSRMISQEQAGASLRKFSDRVQRSQIKQRIYTDPEMDTQTAIKQVESVLRDLTETKMYDGLDPLIHEEMVSQAKSALNQLYSDANSHEAGADQRYDRARNETFNELFGLARNRQLTAQQFEEANSFWNFDDTQQRAMGDLMSGKSFSPNPDAQMTARTRANSMTDPISQDELVALYPLIGPEEYTAASARAAETEARMNTAIGKRHAQAEQLIRTGLHSGGPFGQIDTNAQQALSLALDELTRRSSAFDGNEDPEVLAEEITRKYIPRITGALNSRIRNLEATMSYKSGAALMSARESGLSGDAYDEALTQLRELDDLRKEQAVINAESKARADSLREAGQ